MVYSSVETETKLLYGWAIGISVRFGDKHQVKNLYAWVKMTKGGEEELHEQSTKKLVQVGGKVTIERQVLSANELILDWISSTISSM